MPLYVVGGRLLNAKFTNKDGREVVFSPDTNLVLDKLDKGTYNYVNGEWYNSIGSGGHKVYDMLPYDRLMENGNEEAGIKPAKIKKQYHLFGKNSDYWKLVR